MIDFDMSCILNPKTPIFFYRERGGWIAFLISSECCEKNFEYKLAASNILHFGSDSVYGLTFRVFGK